MGWTRRRSPALGPVRFTFSKSDLDTSVVDRGAWISTGARGTYVHVGAGGFRYFCQVDGQADPHQIAPLPQSPAPSAGRSRTIGRNVGVVEPFRLVDTSADELLEEIRRKQQVIRLVPLAISVSAIAFLTFLLILDAPDSSMARTGALAVGILSLISVPWFSWRDRKARTVRVHYIFDAQGARLQENLHRLIAAFERAHAVWAVKREHVHGDWKRNAGADTSVWRRRVNVGWGAPSFISTNARIGFLDTGEGHLCFFPDRLLIISSGGVRAVQYREIEVRAGSVQFREEGGVPRDGKVVGKTWHFVNKSGGPDRRFNNNYQVPIVLYGTLEVSAPSGLRLSLQTSTEELASGSVDILLSIKDAVLELESRNADVLRLDPLPPFADDPAPLFLTGSKVVLAVLNVTTFRWVQSLPEWAGAIVWGLVFALPVVALLSWLAGGSVGALFLLASSIILTGAAVGQLLTDRRRGIRETDPGESPASRAHFSALLKRELANRRLEDVDFSKLLAASNITRDVANEVVDELFLKIASRLAAKKTHSERDRVNLELLGRALGMDSERLKRLQKGAKLDFSVASPARDGVSEYSVKPLATKDPEAGGGPQTAAISQPRPLADAPTPPKSRFEGNVWPFPPAVPLATAPADLMPVPLSEATELEAPRLPHREVGATGREAIPLDFGILPETRLPIASPRKDEEFRWLGKGETVSVRGYMLRDPLVYLSQRRPRKEEASCIDLSLEIGNPIHELSPGLGYYPTYAGLTPVQRANYLRWLCSGRADPLDDIGYAFLYFYGLERRLLVERQDLSPIVKEVVRLLQTYTHSGSFDEYLSRFLAFSLARAGIDTLKEKWFDAVFSQSRVLRDEEFLAVALAWFFKRNAPLPAAWAFRVSLQDPRCPRGVVLDRLPEQFRALFEKCYLEKFGQGLVLKVSRRDRTLGYRPASPSHCSLDGSASSMMSVKIPNVLGIQSQFSPLVALWSDCIDQLRPLSRVVAKGKEVHTREAFESLPEQLKSEVEHPDKSLWDRMVAEHTQEDGCAIVEVSNLATLYGFEARAKLTTKQSQSLAQTATSVGLDIEPDPRITNRPYGWEDLVSLLRPEGRPRLPSDSRYVGASLMLELGLYIAASDGQIDNDEVDQVARFLGSQFLLDPPDARRLEALKRILVRRPPSITGLGKRFQLVLSEAQRESVGQFLAGIAAANGVIDRRETSALRNAYRALGLDIGSLTSLLEQFRRASQEPVEVQQGDGGGKHGEAIPQRPDKENASTGIMLDENLLKRILGETHQVAIILGEAMRETEFSEEGRSPTPQPVTHGRDPRFDGLSERHQGLLLELLRSSVWARGDFESLVRRYELLPAGTCEVINEWTDERFGDQLILEEGEELIIQLHLLESKS